MMGRSHVISGWCTGVLVGSRLPIPAAAVIGFGCVGAGAAALNDLDHDDAAASRVLGPISRLLAETVQCYARWIYRRTRGQGDPEHRGAHRGATHALPLLPIPCAALWVMPWIVAAVARSVGKLHTGWDPDLMARWAGATSVAMVIGFCLLLVADRLGSRVLIGAAGLALLLGGAQTDIHDPAGLLWSLAPWTALAVLVGTVTHVLGDLVTECGLYALAPFYRVGEGKDRKHWVRIALPRWLAFKTGHWFENWVVFPLLAGSAVLVTPVVGAWTWAHIVLALAGHGPVRT